jgi:hypothetical protein
MRRRQHGRQHNGADTRGSSVRNTSRSFVTAVKHRAAFVETALRESHGA